MFNGEIRDVDREFGVLLSQRINFDVFKQFSTAKFSVKRTFMAHRNRCPCPL